MGTDDRLERLEQRIAVLEGLVRQLVTSKGRELPLEQPERPPARPPVSPSPPEFVGPSPAVTEPLRPSRPPPSIEGWVGAHARGPAATPSPEVTASAPRPDIRRPRDAEQWMGQRGLLGVGVLFVILAAGYLLKYSFDQGWVSPLVRCTSGAITGIAVGAVGWWLHDRGLRTYGAALVGCGAAIVYIAVWAASYLYSFLPPPQGIAGLALVSLALAAVAYAIDLEALGATAVAGAFLAPVLLGREPAQADLLMLYLSFMAAALGWVAARKRWRFASFLIAVSYFGLGTASNAADRADPWRVLLFGVLGGSAGLYVGLREGWWETRLPAFAGGWALVAAASDRIGAPWAVVLAGICLAAPVWWHALRTQAFWSIRGAAGEKVSAWSIGEALYFFTTPMLLGWAVHLLAPDLFGRHHGLVPLIIAVPYLVTGFARPHPEFALVGTTAAGFAGLAEWSGLEAVWALLGLSLLWAALDHLLKRTDGRWFALLALGVALAHLLLSDVDARPDSDPAFVDRWALSLWATVLCLAVLARGLWRHPQDEVQTASIPAALWTVAGTLLFFGVTRELPRYFGARDFVRETRALASGLSIIVWWLLFFAVLFVLGVQRTVRRLRVVAVLGFIAAIACLAYADLDLRSDVDAAFWGLWAGTLWLAIALFAGLATWFAPRAEEFTEAPHQVLLWSGAGILLLLGVTGELDRYFGHRDLAPGVGDLASGLAISAWWILFAGGLVLLGFQRDLQRVRQAGLLVAAMATLKILVHDLSSLNALYRIGSVFITGLVSLGLAYLYNKKAHVSQD